MSDYNGPERRTDPHYCHIGANRFERMEVQLSEVREKIFNGLSHLPATVEAVRKMIITLVVVVILGGLAGAGFWIYKLGTIEQKLTDHIEWGYEQQADNEELFDDIERALFDIDQMDSTGTPAPSN